MAKRFTDTEKWKKRWFRELSPKMKCAWSYLCDMCDHAGIWEEDFDLMKTFIGCEVTAEEIEKTFPGRIMRLKNAGEMYSGKWLIVGFISFQYKELKSTNKVHISVRDRIASVAPQLNADELAKYPNVTLIKPLPSPSLTPSEISQGLSDFLQGDKETDTDKDMDKETDTEKEIKPLHNPSGRVSFVLEGA